MIIRPVTSSDFESIASIHKASYSSEHLTSFFPPGLLSTYYRTVWNSNPYAFIAINENEEPVGFVIGGSKLDAPIKKFIRSHKWALALVLIKRPKFIFLRIADRFKKTAEQKHTSIPFQLLSIAVRTDKQTSGCGKLLLLAFEKQLRKDNVRQYGLSVKKTNKQAILFYERNGFEIEFETFTIRCYYKNI
jgi:ribosomal protein S18 acetylase RimI-like enzyme